jgi:hypothetical protein
VVVVVVVVAAYFVTTERCNIIYPRNSLFQVYNSKYGGGGGRLHIAFIIVVIIFSYFCLEARWKARHLNTEFLVSKARFRKFKTTISFCAHCHVGYIGLNIFNGVMTVFLHYRLMVWMC